MRKPLPNKKPVDLRSLAAELELSESTISRALRDHPSIPDKTRARVADLAKRRGYVPNATARGLATGRAGALGLAFPLERLQLSQSNFVDVLSGISVGAAERDFRIMLSPFSEDDEEAVLRGLVASKTIDGVILTRPLLHDWRIALLHNLEIPFVVHGRSDVDIPYAYVDIENISVFEKLTNLLLDYGHRRIAALNFFQQFRFAAARSEGYLRALAARGVGAEPSLLRETPMTAQSGYEHAADLLRSDMPPTAFVCGSIFLARGVYRAVHELGLTVPADVSVVCHDDRLRDISPLDFDPPVTCTQSSASSAGHKLAEMLIDLIEAAKVSEPPQFIVPFSLVLHESVALAPLR